MILVKNKKYLWTFFSFLLVLIFVVLHPVKAQGAVQLPFALDSRFSASGWFADGEAPNHVTYKRVPEDVNGQQKIVTIISYHPGPQGFAGIYWQYPANNWGQYPGLNLSGAHAITFFAKGEHGGEIVEFKSGGISGKRYKDSYQAVSTGPVILNQQWTPYKINLSGSNLSNVIGAFVWVVSAKDNGNRNVTTFITDVQVE